MNRLADKARLINFDDMPADGGAPTTASPDVPRPRTGPGAISASLTMGKQVVDENEKLRARVAELEDAEVIEFLEPHIIGPSDYANRDESHFETAEFQALRAEIASAGRNVQAIKVRLLKQPRPDGVLYEIVFGHRRHRACMLEGLKVAAIVERDLGDQELFIQMDRENRAREDLSPYEQGVMYNRAIEKKLFPSIRNMAERVGADHGNISKAMQLASLPPAVIAAFSSPLDLQFRWGGLLQEAINKNEERVLATAEEIRNENPRPAAKEVFERLTATPGALAAASAEDLQVGETKVGTWVRDARGNLTIKLKANALSGAKEARLREAVRKALG